MIWGIVLGGLASCFLLGLIIVHWRQKRILRAVGGDCDSDSWPPHIYSNSQLGVDIPSDESVTSAATPAERREGSPRPERRRWQQSV